MKNFNALLTLITSLIISVLTISCNSASHRKQIPEKVKIILDTDIGSDCDDAGALAVMHKLADKGEVEILGIIFSSNANKYGAGVCDAINRYYGRTDLPLGQFQEDVTIGDPNDSYSRYIASAHDKYGHTVTDSTTESTMVYKQILKSQADKSITIITIGHPVALYFLLKDQEGKQLVNQKVNRWIAMTHTDTIPVNDWNFGKNGTAPFINELIDLWPTQIFFSGAGKDIITGNKKLPDTPDYNPVKKAYKLWGNNALKNGRSSWDQIAVLYAARPEYFTVEKGTLIQNEAYETYWNPKSKQEKHFRIIPQIEKQQLEEIIEDLMAEVSTEI